MQKFLGSTSPLSDEDEDDLIEQLLEFFGEFTLGEMRYAVKMAAAGELEIKNTEHYDRFGGMYLEKILTPYRAFRNRIMGQYDRKIIDRAYEQSQQKSPEEIYMIIRDGVLQKYKQFHKEKFTFDYGNVSFRFLYALGIIPKIEGERKENLKAKALERIKTAADYTKDKNEKKDMRALVDLILKGEMSNSKKLFAEMMLIALNEFFETLSHTGVDLETMISEAEKTRKKLVLESHDATKKKKKKTPAKA